MLCLLIVLQGVAIPPSAIPHLPPTKDGPISEVKPQVLCLAAAGHRAHPARGRDAHAVVKLLQVQGRLGYLQRTGMKPLAQ